MEHDPRSDAVLITAAGAGDVAAFGVLYSRHRDWVVRLAYRFTRNEPDALDVLQDAFAHLLKKMPGFRLRAKMTTYLYPVVKNLSISLLRRRGRTVADEAGMAQVPAPEAPGGRLDDLAAVLSILPDEQREVVLLRFVDGFSLEEIAEAVRIPTGTVKSRLHHALRKLREDSRTRRYFNPSGGAE